jgi:hypothetical protein
MPKTPGGQPVSVRREEILIVRPEEAYEHVNFRFEGAR